MSNQQFSEEMKNTVKYYNTNAEDFFNQTYSLDLEHLYNHFTPLLPSGGNILDAGCGSGRDSLNFINKGFQVHAFDASKELAEKAEQLTGIKVQVLSFLDLKYNEEFDGIWACASLLHLPFDSLKPAFDKLFHALKPNGYMYVSFKYGTDEVVRNGRLFCNMDENKFNEVIGQFDGIRIAEMWKTNDARPDRAEEIWLNVVVQKYN